MLPGPKRRISPSLVAHSISPASVTQNQCFGVGCQVASQSAPRCSKVAALVAIEGPTSTAGLPGTNWVPSRGTLTSSKRDSPSGVANIRGYCMAPPISLSVQKHDFCFQAKQPGAQRLPLISERASHLTLRLQLSLQCSDPPYEVALLKALQGVVCRRPCSTSSTA